MELDNTHYWSGINFFCDIDEEDNFEDVIPALKSNVLGMAIRADWQPFVQLEHDGFKKLGHWWRKDVYYGDVTPQRRALEIWTLNCEPISNEQEKEWYGTIPQTKLPKLDYRQVPSCCGANIVSLWGGRTTRRFYEDSDFTGYGPGSIFKDDTRATFFLEKKGQNFSNDLKKFGLITLFTTAEYRLWIKNVSNQGYTSRFIVTDRVRDKLGYLGGKK